jgi:hypothetical protein
MPESKPRLTGTPEPGLAGAPDPGQSDVPEPDPGLAAMAKPEPSLADVPGPGSGRAGAEPDALRGYLAVLAARLPPSVTDELADGLIETYQSYQSRGLAREAAAVAAVAEFGPAEEIAAAFTPVNPARRAARRLLGIGPTIGGCWVAALLTSRSGLTSRAGLTSPGPAWVVAGLALAGFIGLLAVAALGRRYRLAALTGVAGCFGYAALDLALIISAPILLAPVGWVTAVAMAASSARIALTIRLLRPALARLYTHPETKIP